MNRPEDWNDQVNSEMLWQKGRANAVCPHIDGCKGPSVANLGNVESGFIAIGTCRMQCAHNIRSAIPDAIVFPEESSTWVPLPQVPDGYPASVVQTVDDGL